MASVNPDPAPHRDPTREDIGPAELREHVLAVGHRAIRADMHELWEHLMDRSYGCPEASRN